jgi:protein TonB
MRRLRRADNHRCSFVYSVSLESRSLHPIDARHAAARRARRLLALALVASAAVHAAVIAFLPLFRNDDYEFTRLSALEVVLAKPEPPPVSASQPAEPRAEPEPAQRARKRATAPVPAQPPVETSRPRAENPVLALPEKRPAAEPAHTVRVVKAAESRAAPPEPKAEAVAAAPAPAVAAAAYLRNPPPRYPLAARRAGDQGTVTLKVLVSREGMAARVDVEKTSGSIHLDSAALETVKTWRFAPARRGAEPIESWVLVPIVFRLEGTS